MIHNNNILSWIEKNIIPKRTPKIRVGRNRDGGYVIPTKSIEDCDLCISFGLGYDISFENDIISKKITVVGYDIVKHVKPWARITKLETYNDFVAISEVEQANKILLKIDTEGAEWNFFATINSEHFKNKVHTMVFELHLHKNPKNLPLSVMDKALESHHVIHVHANNYSQNWIKTYIDSVPNSLEITLANKKYFGDLPLDKRKYPLPRLDYKNNPNLPDVSMRWLKYQPPKLYI